MAGIFDRLESIIRSHLREDERTLFGGAFRNPYREGGDFQDAWRELDEYLNGGGSRGFDRAEPLRGDPLRSRPFEQTSDRPVGPPPPPAKDESLRRDYANLQVPFRSDFQDVKRGYKLLLKTYHPDRFAQDPEKVRSATEVTKKLNESFRRIKRFRETGDMEG